MEVALPSCDRSPAYSDSFSKIWFSPIQIKSRIFRRGIRIIVQLSCVVVFAFSGSLKAQSINLDSGLVAHFPMEANALDLSKNANHGLLEGYKYYNVPNQNGEDSSSILFAGRTIIRASHIPEYKIANEISISFWLFSNGKNGWILQRGISQQYSTGSREINYGLAVVNSSFLRFYFGNGKYQSIGLPLEFGWHHVVVTAKSGGDSVAFYFNGQRSLNKYSKTHSVSLDTIVETDLFIGNYNKGLRGGPGLSLGLQFHDMRIYNRLLKLNEIQALISESNYNTQSKYIHSNRDVMVASSFAKDWFKTSFDISSWGNSIVAKKFNTPYSYFHDSTYQIWTDQTNDTCYFVRDFNLNKLDVNGFAEMKLNGICKVDVYVNGTPILSDTSASPSIIFVDSIYKHLSIGHNRLAIRAVRTTAYGHIHFHLKMMNDINGLRTNLLKVREKELQTQLLITNQSDSISLQKREFWVQYRNRFSERYRWKTIKGFKGTGQDSVWIELSNHLLDPCNNEIRAIDVKRKIASNPIDFGLSNPLAINRSLRFDGVPNQKFEVTIKKPNFENDFTLFFQVNADPRQLYPYSHHLLRIDGLINNTINLHEDILQDRNSTSTYLIPGGRSIDLSKNWSSLIIMNKNDSLNYYHNGRLINKSYKPNIKLLDSIIFAFGGSSGGDNWKGLTDDILFLDRGLSKEEIQALTNFGPELFRKGAIYYEKFDQTSCTERASIDYRITKMRNLRMSNGPKYSIGFHPKIIPTNDTVVVDYFFNRSFDSLKLFRNGFSNIDILSVDSTSPEVGHITLSSSDSGSFNLKFYEDGEQELLSNVLEVTNQKSVDLWVDANSRSVARIGRKANLTVSYGNKGFHDVGGALLWLVVKGDTSFNIEPSFKIDTFANDSDWALNHSVNFDQFNYFFRTNSLKGEKGPFTIYPTYIHSIKGRRSYTLNFEIDKFPRGNIEFRAIISDPLIQSPFDTNAGKCVSGITKKVVTSVIKDFSKCANGFFELTTSFDSDPKEKYIEKKVIPFGMQLVKTFGSCGLSVAKNLPQTRLARIVWEVYEAVDKYEGVIDDAILIGNCVDAFAERFASEETETRTVGSFDPNELVGPSNKHPYNPNRLKSKFTYRVYFENVDTATAAAQEVMIDVDLDTSYFDLSSISFNSINYANNHFELTGNNPTLDQLHDLPLHRDQQLKVTSYRNDNGILKIRFLTIDRNTKELTADPIIGFLPPNDSNSSGEGFVEFTIEPRTGLLDGDTIKAQATIVFDVNEPIKTNTWSNIVDRTSPTSFVDPLIKVHYTSADSIKVSWSGNDMHSGVNTYDVFYKTDTSQYWFQWLNDFDGTANYFKAGYGITYSFVSFSKDFAGNEEVKDTLPESETRLIHTKSHWGHGHYECRNKFHVFNDVLQYTGNCYGTIRIFDLAGRELYKGSSEKGVNLMNTGIRRGVYVFNFKSSEGSEFTVKHIAD